MFDIPLAWLQLTRERARLLAAASGVAFAVLLVFMQLGIRDALYDSAVRLHRALTADIVLIHPQSSYLVMMKPFSHRRLYQASGFEGVESVSPLYATTALWKNPVNGGTRIVFILGFDPSDRVLSLPEVNRQRAKLRVPDVLLFDEDSRPEYGPIAAEVRAGKAVATDVGYRHTKVAGLFKLGTSFGIDGTVITSAANFLRLVPQRPKGLIDLGLIRLRPGTDANVVRNVLAANLPADVEVLTQAGFVHREISYWAKSTPIGFSTTFGAVMGMVVGLVIVYQILFADISDHLAEYATLKAIGYTNRYLFGLVLQEATILAVLGFIPGWALSAWLYRLTENATRLPMQMTIGLVGTVLVLTIAMCALSGAIALRKVSSADPAEVF
ncbi:MAG: DevC-like transporter permease protein [Deltaproteobacteria bacterium]|nr:DevC-like transporter permease protein [Deltaproteobacteria bacterium]MBP1774525.1 DevC-like transporter permease protein [candidate division NC10 bacterium]